VRKEVVAFGAGNPIGPISSALRSYLDFKLGRLLAVIEGISLESVVFTRTEDVVIWFNLLGLKTAHPVISTIRDTRPGRGSRLFLRSLAALRAPFEL
jgi:hypothetical protein